MPHHSKPQLRGPGPMEEIDAGGVVLGVRRSGTGPRIVALHGGPGLDHHILLPLARTLGDRFELILPDLPEHGASGRAGRSDARALIEALASWLSNLPGGADALLGHSMGAWLVRELLRERLVHARAAVLISPPAAGQSRALSSFRRAAALARGEGESGEDAARDEFLRHLDAETEGEVSNEILDVMRRADVRPVSAYGRLLPDLEKRIRSPVRPFDPGIPVLVLCGRQDRTTPREQAVRVASATAGSRLQMIDRAGHYPFVDAPEATATAIRSFLRAALR